MKAQASKHNGSRFDTPVALVAAVQSELTAIPPVIKSEVRWISWRAWWAHVAGLFHCVFTEPRIVREIGPDHRPLERHEFEKAEYRSYSAF